MKCIKILFIVLCCFFLVSCNKQYSDLSSPTSIESENQNETHSANKHGLFSMRDFSEIIPGISSYDDVRAVYGEYGQFSLLSSKAIVFIPTPDENELTIIIKLPEWIVQSIRCAAPEWNDSEQCDIIRVDEIFLADRLFEIVPGESSYKDVSYTCNQDLGEFPRSRGVEVRVPISNGSTVSVLIDRYGEVRCVEYGCKSEGIVADRVFSMAEFKEFTPGFATFSSIGEMTQDSGLRIRSDKTDTTDQQILVLPAINGNQITFTGTSSDDYVNSIVLSNPEYHYDMETDTTIVEIPQGIMFQLINGLNPGHDTYETIFEKDTYDLGRFPREKGLSVQVPAEKGCVFVILLDPDGRLISVTWKVA